VSSPEFFPEKKLEKNGFFLGDLNFLVKKKIITLGYLK